MQPTLSNAHEKYIHKQTSDNFANANNLQVTHDSNGCNAQSDLGRAADSYNMRQHMMMMSGHGEFTTASNVLKQNLHVKQLNTTHKDVCRQVNQHDPADYTHYLDVSQHAPNFPANFHGVQKVRDHDNKHADHHDEVQQQQHHQSNSDYTYRNVNDNNVQHNVQANTGGFMHTKPPGYSEIFETPDQQLHVDAFMMQQM